MLFAWKIDAVIQRTVNNALHKISVVQKRLCIKKLVERAAFECEKSLVEGKTNWRVIQQMVNATFHNEGKPKKGHCLKSWWSKGLHSSMKKV